jgi:AcrR family transcriptional regulator
MLDTVSEPGEPKMRADARRNREQIVDAAATLFVERGADVPMEEIARGAGVGVGTLYRRFPDREALVRAVALDAFRRVVAAARAALAEPDGWGGLVRFVRESVADLRLAALLSIWFAGAWTRLQADSENLRLRDELLGLLDQLVVRAQREGAVRPDIAAGDVAVLLALVLRPLPGALGAITAHAGERYVAVVLDGLRAAPVDPLPGRRVSVADLPPPGSAG